MSSFSDSDRRAIQAGRRVCGKLGEARSEPWVRRKNTGLGVS